MVAGHARLVFSRDQDGLARGRGGAEETLVARMAAGALLPLALQVEERVVDADRHPHQQHHRLGGVGGVSEVAEQLGEPERAEHGRERQ